MENKMIAFDDTNFCYFGRNLAGNAERNLSHKPTRTCAILVPESMVGELMDRGINVKERVDKETEKLFHYVNTTLAFTDSHGTPLRYPPKVYLVNENHRAVPLPEEAITDELDYQPIRCVNVVLNPYEYQLGKWCLYIRTMYIEPDYDRIAQLREREKEFDPYASRYAQD
jgi:hypothetical protein